MLRLHVLARPGECADALATLAQELGCCDHITLDIAPDETGTRNARAGAWMLRLAVVVAMMVSGGARNARAGAWTLRLQIAQAACHGAKQLATLAQELGRCDKVGNVTW